MASNTPNVSRDSFDFTDLYLKVAIQQGVPLPDSDLNEQTDNLRIWRMMLAQYALIGNIATADGAGQTNTGVALDGGFAPSGSGLSQDFTLAAGAAIVGGELVLSDTAFPTTSFNYADTTRNFIVNKGTVTSTSAGTTIIDTSKNWQAFHDLLSTASHGPSRVEMLSGAESGNFFDITAFTTTDLTLSGGIAGILATDTFRVVPPVLTTFGGPGDRSDQIYLQVWWEDISEAEDASIVSPGLGGIESSHREEIRFVVRVEEDGTMPSTPVVHGFGVRYMYLQTMDRSAGVATIPSNAFLPGGVTNVSSSLRAHTLDATNPHSLTATQVTSSAVGFISSLNVQAALAEITTDLAATSGAGLSGVAGGYIASALSAITGGGLGTSAEVNAALTETNSQLVRRRSFMGVITDGTASTGGDFNGATAIEQINDATKEGIYYLRPGTHEGVNVLGFTTTDQKVVGDNRSTTEVLHVTAAVANQSLTGYWERISFPNTTAFSWFISSFVGSGSSFANCKFAPGVIVGESDVVFRDCDWTEDGVPSDLAIVASLVIDGSGDETGAILFDNCTFEPPTPTGNVLAAVLIDDNVGAGSNDASRPIVFRDCQFTADDKAAIQIGTVTGSFTQNILFDSCKFVGNGDDVPMFQVVGSVRNVVVRNCTIVCDGGLLFEAEFGGITFEDCTFYSGSTAPTSGVGPLFDSNGQRCTLTRCQFYVGSANVDTVVDTPIIDLAGVVALSHVTIQMVAGVGIHDGTILNIVRGEGLGSLFYPRGGSRIDGLTVDCNSNAPAVLSNNSYLDVQPGASPFSVNNLVFIGPALNGINDARNGIDLSNCEVTGVAYEGPVTPGSGGNNHSSASLISLRDCNCVGLIIGPTRGPALGTAASLITLVSLVGTDLFGGRVEVAPTDPPTRGVLMNASVCQGFHWETTTNIPNDAFYDMADDDHSVLTDSDGGPISTGTALFVDGQGDDCRVMNCEFTSNTAGAFIVLTGARCIVMGNIVRVPATGATITNGGTDSITPAGTNIIL